MFFPFSITDLMIALAAVVGIFFGICQLNNSNKTQTADFIHRLKKDFIIEETRNIIFLLNLNAIYFKEPDNEINDAYFLIDKKKVNKLEKFKKLNDYTEKINYRLTALEMDDFVLGHFEDLGLFEKEGILKLEFIYESFDYFLQLVHNNYEIQKYIRWQRKQDNCLDVYDYFDYIASKCRLFGQKKKIS